MGENGGHSKLWKVQGKLLYICSVVAVNAETLALADGEVGGKLRTLPPPPGL